MWISSAAVAPGMCCAVVTGMSGLSYHPRAANAPSAKFSCNSTVPPPGAPPPPLPPPPEDELVVAPLAAFERPPNTAFTLRVPRYATSSKLYVVPADKPLPPIVATAALLEVQATLRPVSPLPLASFSVAARCCVPPVVTVAVAGATLTDATGATTAQVLLVAMFDRAPNTASTFRVPRYATTSKL